jgi:hypothetical protein
MNESDFELGWRQVKSLWPKWPGGNDPIVRDIWRKAFSYYPINAFVWAISQYVQNHEKKFEPDLSKIKREIYRYAKAPAKTTLQAQWEKFLYQELNAYERLWCAYWHLCSVRSRDAVESDRERERVENCLLGTERQMKTCAEVRGEQWARDEESAINKWHAFHDRVRRNADTAAACVGSAQPGELPGSGGR